MDQKQLLLKYNYPVPRYTSYPPANYFSGDYTSQKYMIDLKASNGLEPENISVYFHIPFCKTKCHYCGCNMLPLKNEAEVIDYTDGLKKEINMVCRFLDKNRKVSQIHFGGGTPNSINGKYIAELNKLISDKFKFINEPEIAIELNPAYLDEEYLKYLSDAGFNRFSLGIQDFEKSVLSNVNRKPSAIPLEELISRLRSIDKGMVNLDFIYGLPGQTVNSFVSSIKKAIELKPDRIVTFSYAHVPWVNKSQKILENIGLPAPEEKTAMYTNARNSLKAAGYRAIGMDHYVLPADPLFKSLESGELHRNFQGYCTRKTTGQVYAFGVSAISQLATAYSQNTKSISEYIKSLNENILPVVKGYSLGNKEIIVRDVITYFMCNKKLIWSEIAEHLNLNVRELKEALNYNESEIRRFENDGILNYTNEGFELTQEGNLFIRNVAASLDPGFKIDHSKFSKSV